MYSKFSSLSFMGMSNSEFFIHEKDHNPVERNFMSRPLLQFQESCQLSQQEEKGEDKCEVLVSNSLEIKLPSLGEFKVEENDEGCTTPTSLEHKIPMICPPPPRKPKSLPSKKRKASSSSSQRRILLDYSTEIESMFPPALVADLGNKIKKVRTA